MRINGYLWVSLVTNVHAGFTRVNDVSLISSLVSTHVAFPDKVKFLLQGFSVSGKEMTRMVSYYLAGKIVLPTRFYLYFNQVHLGAYSTERVN